MSLQLHFALSSLTCWRIIDGDFNAHVFCQNIVDYFEAPPGPAAKTRICNLLLWWDRYETLSISNTDPYTIQQEGFWVSSRYSPST